MRRKRRSYHRLDRAEFVKSRYASFVKTRDYVKKHGLDDLVILTDLDKKFGGEKPMRDVVICD